MTIIYDDLTEFAEVRLRCENTRKKSMCKYCPFYDRCTVDEDENLHTMCCEIASMKSDLSAAHAIKNLQDTLEKEAIRND